MENKFKIPDFIGKSLIISLGIIATAGGFIDMFNIPASKVAVSLFTICITFLLMTTSRARHKHLAMTGIFVTVILLILINWNGIKCGIYYIANRIIDAYNYYAGITESDMFIIDFGKPIFFSSTKQSVTFTLCMIIIEYAYILVTASIYKVFSSIHILLSAGINYICRSVTWLISGNNMDNSSDTLLCIMCDVWEKQAHLHKKNDIYDGSYSCSNFIYINYSETKEL